MATSDSAFYDIIVVGGGAAGCVIASRLSETTSLRILLLEAGPDNNDDPKVTTPLRSRQMFGDPNYDWDYRTTRQKNADNRVILQTRGRMLGGSSAINSHSLVYPSQAMHDSWAEIAGDAAWSWAKMQRFYDKFQTVQASDQMKGSATALPTTGPIQASFPRNLNKLQAAWEETFKELDCFHTSYGTDGQAIGGTTTTNAIDSRDGKGERSHAGKAYLQTVRGRDNLTIVTEARVKKINFEQVNGAHNKLLATGVLYEKDGQSISARARQEVVLCAGVFGSSQLLEVSGIGNQNALDKAGVKCLLHLPSVGENLQDHFNFGPCVEVESSIDIIDGLAGDRARADAAQTEYNSHRTGLLSEGAAYSYAYWPLQLFETPSERVALEDLIKKDSPNLKPLLKLQFDFNRKMLQHPREASATVALLPARRYVRPDESAADNYMTVLAMLAHPFSRGSSHIVSQDSADPPAIDPNYLSHPLDIEVFARHIIQIERFLGNPHFSQILQPGGRRFPDGIDLAQRSQKDLEQLIRGHGGTNYHPCGTCVMASADLEGVVDAELFVRGVENLRVCDASIFPIIPRGNILTSVYAVAEKGAEMICEKYKQGEVTLRTWPAPMFN